VGACRARPGRLRHAPRGFTERAPGTAAAKPPALAAAPLAAAPLAAAPLAAALLAAALLAVGAADTSAAARVCPRSDVRAGKVTEIGEALDIPKVRSCGVCVWVGVVCVVLCTRVVW
jgi:hypothetical protein